MDTPFATGENLVEDYRFVGSVGGGFAVDGYRFTAYGFLLLL
jgi:hypothetical protein